MCALCGPEISDHNQIEKQAIRISHWHGLSLQPASIWWKFMLLFHVSYFSSWKLLPAVLTQMCWQPMLWGPFYRWWGLGTVKFTRLVYSWSPIHLWTSNTAPPKKRVVVSGHFTRGTVNKGISARQAQMYIGPGLRKQEKDKLPFPSRI